MWFTCTGATFIAFISSPPPCASARRRLRQEGPMLNRVQLKIRFVSRVSFVSTGTYLRRTQALCSEPTE